jgi:hypothetical protein
MGGRMMMMMMIVAVLLACNHAEGGIAAVLLPHSPGRSARLGPGASPGQQERTLLFDAESDGVVNNHHYRSSSRSAASSKPSVWRPVWTGSNFGASVGYHRPFEGNLPNVDFGLRLLRQHQDWRWLQQHSSSSSGENADPCCDPLRTNTSCWEYNATDSTAAIQAALDCASAEVIIPRLPGLTPWIVTPLLIASSNLTLILQPGVVLMAKKGAFTGKGDSMLSIVNASNVTLRAHGATLQMRKMDYLAPPYKKAEWRMGINMIGARNVHIIGVTVNQSGGDGLYIGGTGSKGTLSNSVNVTVTDALLIGNNRQGLSICAGQNVLVERSVFAETNGTGPSSGVDFEPNSIHNKLENITLRDCISRDNANMAYGGGLHSVGAQEISIVLDNCTATGGPRGGFFMEYVSSVTTGLILYKNCLAYDLGESAVATEHKEGGPTMSFVNCTFRNVSSNFRGYNASIPCSMPVWSRVVGPGHDDKWYCTPIYLSHKRSEGGVHFHNCSLHDSYARNWLWANPFEAGEELYNVTGEVDVYNPHGCTANVSANAFNVTLKARCHTGPVPTPAPAPPRICGNSSWTNASCWGWDPVDATHALQSAINSNASTVFVPNMNGAVWNVQPIHLNASVTGGQTIILENGVRIVALIGAFLGKGDCLFSVVKVDNVRMFGYGAEISMRRDDYEKPPYEASSFRMGINILGSRNITVEGIRVTNTGGDGIYIGPADSHVYADSHAVTVRNVTVFNASRCGLGITGVVGLHVQNVIVSETHGASPESAVDIEPGSKYHHAQEIVFDNVTLQKSGSHNFAISLHGIESPVSITLNNTRLLDGHRGGFFFVYIDESQAGFIRIHNSSIGKHEEGCVIFEHKAVAPALEFRIQDTQVGPGCAYRGRGMYDKPIFFNANHGDTGHVNFSNVSIQDNLARGFLESKCSASGKTVEVRGDFSLSNPKVACSKSCCAEFKPVGANNSVIVDCVNASIHPRLKSDDMTPSWLGHVVINYMNRSRKVYTDQLRRSVLAEFDPDYSDWDHGIEANGADIFNSRGIPTSAHASCEYQEGGPKDAHASGWNSVFLRNGVGSDELGLPAIISTRHNLTEYGLSQIAPRWHQYQKQCQVRAAIYGSTSQDNIGVAESSFGDFGGWSDRLFVKANPQLGLRANFSMSALVAKLRAAGTDPMAMIMHPVVHEYIRFCMQTHIDRFRDILTSAKATVASSGQPAIAVYGNLGGSSPGLTGEIQLSNALAQVADVVWIESWDFELFNSAPSHSSLPFNLSLPGYGNTSNFGAWSTLLLKVGRASGNFTRPVWVDNYAHNDATMLILMAEAAAQGCVKIIGPLWNSTVMGGEFWDQNRFLFNNQLRRPGTEVAVIFSLPSLLWRRFSSLALPAYSNSSEYVCHLKHDCFVSWASRWLEDATIPHEALIFSGLDRIFDDRGSVSRLSEFKVLILPAVDALSDRHIAALKDFEAQGGQLIVWGSTNELGMRTEELTPRSAPPFHGSTTITAIADDLVHRYADRELQAAMELTKLMDTALPVDDRLLTFENRPSVVWASHWRHGAGPMQAIHLVNYIFDQAGNQSQAPVMEAHNLTVRMRVDLASVLSQAVLYAPEHPPLPLPLFRLADGLHVEVTVPSMQLYAVVAFGADHELQARQLAADGRKSLERLKLAAIKNANRSTFAALVTEAEAAIGNLERRAQHEFAILVSPLAELKSKLSAAVDAAAEQTVAEAASARLATLQMTGVHRFDFGGDNVSKGWMGVFPNSSYGSADTPMFGWISSSVQRMAADSCGSGSTNNDGLHCDHIQSYSGNPDTFRVSGMVKGNYMVTVVIGCLTGILSEVGITPVSANGVAVCGRDRVHWGAFHVCTFSTPVVEDTLDLRFGSAIAAVPPFGSGAMSWAVTAIVIQRSGVNELTPQATKSFAAGRELAKAAIRAWAALGIFSDRNATAISTRHPAESDSNLNLTYAGKSGTLVGWRRLQSNGSFPEVRLDSGDMHAFGAVDEDALGSFAIVSSFVKVIDACNATLRVSLSGTGTVSLNDAVVATDGLDAGVLQQAEVAVRVKLAAGWNRISIKTITQYGVSWGFYAALFDEENVHALARVTTSACGPQHSRLCPPTQV